MFNEYTMYKQCACKEMWTNFLLRMIKIEESAKKNCLQMSERTI
jgi:hypothetical protein